MCLLLDDEAGLCQHSQIGRETIVQQSALSHDRHQPVHRLRRRAGRRHGCGSERVRRLISVSSAADAAARVQPGTVSAMIAHGGGRAAQVRAGGDGAVSVVSWLPVARNCCGLRLHTPINSSIAFATFHRHASNSHPVQVTARQTLYALPCACPLHRLPFLMLPPTSRASPLPGAPVLLSHLRQGPRAASSCAAVLGAPAPTWPWRSSTSWRT